MMDTEEDEDNVMIIKGHHCVIKYSAEVNEFRGQYTADGGGGFDFYSDSVVGLMDEGTKSLAFYSNMLKEENK